MTPSVDRAERLAPWLVGVFFALPVLIAKYPPMSDLPLHEASIGLLRHWGDDRFAPKTLYFLNLGQINQLFSFLALAAAYVMPIGWASKVVIAAILVALPVAAGRFADHLGASRWSALLVAPLGFGWMFFWGLVQNILGLAVLLALLPAIDRFAARPTVRGAARMCAGLVLLHFAHQAMQLVACAALVLCCIGPPFRARLAALRAAPLLFCAGLIGAATRYSWSVAGSRHVNTPLFRFYTLTHKVTTFSGVLFGGYEPWVRNVMLALAVAPLVLFVVSKPRWNARNTTAETVAVRVRAWRFELLSLVLFAIYLAAPANIKSTTLVYHRFLPPAWAILVVCCAARPAGAGAAEGDSKRSRLAPILCAVLPLASLLIAWPTFVDSDRMYTDLETLVPSIEPGSAILSLNLGPQSNNRLWNPVCAAGHVVAERGGRSNFDYSQSPVSPVAQRPEKEWTEPVDRLELLPYQMRPDWDLTRFRYLLVITPDRPLANGVAFALRTEARLVGSRGDWSLFESRLPVVPIDADEAPMPVPHPATLHKKLAEVVKAIDAAEAGTGPIPELP
jgi:hypothetical protein